jgi:2-aminoadipate transaminase
MNYQELLARRTRQMGVNAIREILKVVSQPGMISLAGGIPSPESFPMPQIQRLCQTVIAKYGSAAFQYDRTEGFAPLRRALSGYLQKKGVAASEEQILTASGSQSVLDALGKVLISRGDRVAVEDPTYLGALQAFTPYEPVYVCLDSDQDGLLPQSLEAALSTQPIKFIYLVPTFQNPTGRTLTLARRRQIAAIIRRRGALLVEDDPYSDLRYSGRPLPPIKSLAPDQVVYVSTLSKVFAPGLRIGFCVAPPLIHQWLVVVKQGNDLHTSTFDQALAAEYLASGDLDRHLPSIIALYRPRQQAMLNALEHYFPQGFSWSHPEGGMFIWARGPEGMDMEAVYGKAVAQKTAFVPGRYFFARQGVGNETLRLNFTMADESAIEAAVRTLAGVLRSEVKG